MKTTNNSVCTPTGVSNKAISRKILIVEDELEVMSSVAVSIDIDGCEICRAYNAKECFNLIGQGLVPDLILLDIMLPDMHGFEVFKKLKNMIQLKKTKIAAFTALCARESVEKMSALGFDRIFLKPFSPCKMISEIKALLQ